MEHSGSDSAQRRPVKRNGRVKHGRKTEQEAHPRKERDETVLHSGQPALVQRYGVEHGVHDGGSRYPDAQEHISFLRSNARLTHGDGMRNVSEPADGERNARERNPFRLEHDPDGPGGQMNTGREHSGFEKRKLLEKPDARRAMNTLERERHLGSARGRIEPDELRAAGLVVQIRIPRDLCPLGPGGAKPTCGPNSVKIFETEVMNIRVDGFAAAAAEVRRPAGKRQAGGWHGKPAVQASARFSLVCGGRSAVHAK